MSQRTLLSFAIAAALLGAAPAAAVELPPICLAQAGHADHMSSGGMGMGGGMNMSGDQAHRDLMAGMDEMNADMMAGGTAADIDVAFVCSMIPHHQGAIDMARAELKHGDDAWARGMAEKIIAAQEAEIAEMLDWLAKQPQ